MSRHAQRLLGRWLVLCAAVLAGAMSAGSVRADDWGCDTGPFTLPMSYGDHGACCDTHDACYYVNKCDAGSWMRVSPIVITQSAPS